MRRRAAAILTVVGLFVAPGLPVALAAAAEPSARWGLGWDPGEEYDMGLTLRHRLGQAWDVGLAAGPNDYKEDRDQTRWDTDDLPESGASRRVSGSRRESGWVRATAARRFWRDGPFAAAALAGLTYQWSNGQRVERYPVSSPTSSEDYFNWRQHSRSDLWRFVLGLRPSWAPTTRLTVEFEAGMAFETGTETTREDTWYDFDPRIVRADQDIPSHSFSSCGGFEWSSLKFIFWF